MGELLCWSWVPTQQLPPVLCGAGAYRGALHPPAVMKGRVLNWKLSSLFILYNIKISWLCPLRRLLFYFFILWRWVHGILLVLFFSTVYTFSAERERKYRKTDAYNPWASTVNGFGWTYNRRGLTISRKAYKRVWMEGPHVGCRLKFRYFVGWRLKFSIFVGCR